MRTRECDVGDVKPAIEWYRKIAPEQARMGEGVFAVRSSRVK
jgi:hypothetical protein